jgi:HNH endonuclease
MSRYISNKLRELVVKRAGYCCEYCLLPLEDSFFPYHIDHVISLKHGGQTILSNLALSCMLCNISKGSDIGTVLLPDRIFIRLFNPRIDVWKEHFEFTESAIYAKTTIGEATIKVLNLNEVERIIERQVIGLK